MIDLNLKVVWMIGCECMMRTSETDLTARGGGMQKRVREPGLEPGASRWQRPIVPLDHPRCVDSPPHQSPLKLSSNLDFVYPDAP